MAHAPGPNALDEETKKALREDAALLVKHGATWVDWEPILKRTRDRFGRARQFGQQPCR